MIPRGVFVGVMLTAAFGMTGGFAYRLGSALAQARAEVQLDEARLLAEHAQRQITERAEQAYEIRKEKIRTVFRDRIIYRNREVPREVVVRQDSACRVPERFVSLWNSANRLQLPNAASLTDETPSAVKLSDIATQHEREAELCHASTEQLIALQQWVREQAAWMKMNQ